MSQRVGDLEKSQKLDGLGGKSKSVSFESAQAKRAKDLAKIVNALLQIPNIHFPIYQCEGAATEVPNLLLCYGEKGMWQELHCLSDSLN